MGAPITVKSQRHLIFVKNYPSGPNMATSVMKISQKIILCAIKLGAFPSGEL
jgi:hypothetical protein